jgi:hypothetical protein
MEEASLLSKIIELINFPTLCEFLFASFRFGFSFCALPTKCLCSLCGLGASASASASASCYTFWFWCILYVFIYLLTLSFENKLIQNSGFFLSVAFARNFIFSTKYPKHVFGAFIYII